MVGIRDGPGGLRGGPGTQQPMVLKAATFRTPDTMPGRLLRESRVGKGEGQSEYR